MKMSKKKIKYLSDILENDIVSGMTKYRLVEELDMLGIRVYMNIADVDRDTLAQIYLLCASHIVNKHKGEGGEIVTTVQRSV